MKLTVRELRERASRVASAVGTLYDIRVLVIDGQSTHPLLAGPFTVTPGVAIQAEQALGHRVDVTAHYRLQADTTDDRAETAWKLRLAIVASWQHESNEAFETADLNCFAVATGMMAIHPYAREAVQSTVGRMGYPPYTMEMMRSPLVEGDDADIELDVVSDDDAPSTDGSPLDAKAAPSP